MITGRLREEKSGNIDRNRKREHKNTDSLTEGGKEVKR